MIHHLAVKPHDQGSVTQSQSIQPLKRLNINNGASFGCQARLLLPAVVTAWLLFVMKWQYDKLVTQSSSIWLQPSAAKQLRVGERWETISARWHSCACCYFKELCFIVQGNIIASVGNIQALSVDQKMELVAPKIWEAGNAVRAYSRALTAHEQKAQGRSLNASFCSWWSGPAPSISYISFKHSRLLPMH